MTYMPSAFGRYKEPTEAEKRQQEMDNAWAQYVQQTLTAQNNMNNDSYRNMIRDQSARKIFNEQYNQIEEAKKAGGAGVTNTTPLADLIAQMEAKRVQALKDQGLNPDGSPIRPEFQTILNPDGTLPEQYQYHPELIDPSQLEGYNMIKQLANTSAGNSEYAQIAKQQNELNRQDAIDAASRQSTSATRGALNTLAMRGGYSSGARERIAAGGANDLMFAKQGAYRNSGNNILDILKQDEAMRRDAVNKFGEAEGKIAFQNNDLTNSASKYNLENILREKDLSRNYDLETYKSALDRWGAAKQADATRASGGGGGGK